MSPGLTRRVSNLETESKDHKRRLDDHDVALKRHEKIFQSFETKFDVIKGSLEKLLNRIPVKRKFKLSWKNLNPWNMGLIMLLLIIGLGALFSNG